MPLSFALSALPADSPADLLAQGKVIEGAAGCAQRVYNCTPCGTSLDRDLNAAINLSRTVG